MTTAKQISNYQNTPSYLTSPRSSTHAESWMYPLENTPAFYSSDPLSISGCSKRSHPYKCHTRISK